MINNIYDIKPPCPRDMGYWYCDDCIRESFELSSEDYGPPVQQCCYKIEGEKVCGGTHLGFSYCKDCRESGKKYASHLGEYIIVATIEREFDDC